jgi:hypothetical protein
MNRFPRSVRRALVLFALVPLLALAACHQAFGTVGHGASATGAGQGTLTNVRTAAQPGFDRVVFDFSGPAAASFAEYVPASGLVAPSGHRVVPNGRFYLRVRFTDARTNASTPQRRTPNLGEVRDIRQVESFEGVVIYAIGVNAKNGFRIFTLGSPNRVAVDVQR